MVNMYTSINWTSKAKAASLSQDTCPARQLYSTWVVSSVCCVWSLNASSSPIIC